MPLLQARQLLGEHLAHRGRVLDDPFLLERLDRGDRRGAGEQVAGVRQAAGEVLVAHPVGDLFPDHHRAERHVA